MNHAYKIIIVKYGQMRQKNSTNNTKKKIKIKNELTIFT